MLPENSSNGVGLTDSVGFTDVRESQTPHQTCTKNKKHQKKQVSFAIPVTYSENADSSGDRDLVGDNESMSKCYVEFNDQGEPLWPCDLQRGDILYRPTMIDDSFFHEGIYVGDGQVVHVSPNRMYVTGISVQKQPLSRFARGKHLKRKTLILHPQAKMFPSEDIAKRAEAMVGRKWPYDRVTNNCETFTTWAATGIDHSSQGELTWLTGSLAAAYYFAKGKKDLASVLAGFIEGVTVAGSVNSILYK